MGGSTLTRTVNVGVSLDDLERFQEEEDASIEQFMTSTPKVT
jgi:hypothetical protein